MMIMFIVDSYGRPRHLSAKDRAANADSVKKLKAKWDVFDNETRIRAAKTIRCLETQGFFR